MSEEKQISDEEIVCPYCGYRHKDTYGFLGQDNMESVGRCNRCKKRFCVMKHVKVQYTTRKED